MTDTITIAVYYLFTIFLIGFTCVYSLTLIANIWDKVPFVPTSGRIVKYIISIADLKKGEKVYDLGCGDGRFLVAAQKKTSMQAVGFENALLPYLLAKLRKFITKAEININMKNFFRADLSKADVIYCYLGPEVMPRVGEKIKNECGKGTRVYSNSFSINTLKPEKIWTRDKKNRLPTIYYYKI